MEKKRKAEEKRMARKERKAAGPALPEESHDDEEQGVPQAAVDEPTPENE